MQKGFSLIVIVLLATVILSVALSGGYYFFQQHKLKRITDYESCAKYFPVLASYPGQCNTSDGRHFVQHISDEEKKKLEKVHSCVGNKTDAKEISTDICKEFASECEVPDGWVKVKQCFIPPFNEDVSGWKEVTIPGKITFKYPTDSIILKNNNDETISLMYTDVIPEHGFNHWITISLNMPGVYSDYNALMNMWAKGIYKGARYENIEKGFKLSGVLKDKYKNETYYSEDLFIKHSNGGMVAVSFKDTIDGPKTYEKILSTIEVY